MAIKPKHSLVQHKTTASRQFTDRDEFVDAFKNNIERKQKEEMRVLMYYGVGGVGKTSLRKKLSAITTVDYPNLMWAIIDFDVANYREPETALYVLRKKLAQTYKVQFPLFDLAYSIYWKKVNPNLPLTKETFPLMEQGGIVADIYSVLGEAPVIGIVPKILNLTLKGKETVTRYIHSMKNELYTLEHMEPSEIIQRLPLYWASDLRKSIENKDSNIVIFIDTYEALWDGQRKTGKFFLQDDWVRELVAQLPEVLWVMCGREKLRWGELDEEWDDYIEQHLIGKLSKLDCQSFLESCGIYDNEIQDIIVESSSGLPYYLDISVDTYEQIVERYERQPQADDFGRTTVELFERFIKYLDQSEIETLKVLSSARFWDKTIFQKLVERFKTGYPITALDQLFNFSFIRQRDEENLSWDMHELMRASLQEYQSKDLFQDTHYFMFDYYNQKLKSDNWNGFIDNSCREALLEGFYHGLQCLTDTDLSNWFASVSEVFREAGNHSLMIPLYEQLIDRLPDNPLALDHMVELIYIYNFKWNFNEAEALLNQALKIIQQSEDKDWLTYASILRSMASLKTRRDGKLEEAEQLILKSLDILTNQLSGANQSEIAACYNQLGLNLNVQNRAEEAQQAYKRAIEIRLAMNQQPDYKLGKYYNNLGFSYYRQGNPKEALVIFKKALAQNEISLGKRSGSYTISLNNIARCCHSFGDYERAKDIYLDVLKLKKEIFGSSHSILSGTYHDLGRLFLDLNDYDQAKPYLEQAISIREKHLGKIHPGVGEILIDYANLLQKTGQDEAAIHQLMTTKQITETVPGMNKQKILALIDRLNKLGKHEAANELNEFVN